MSCLSPVLFVLLSAPPSPMPRHPVELLPLPRDHTPPAVVQPVPVIAQPSAQQAVAESAVPRPITMQEFAATFVPTPGKHVVVFLHPSTHQPVTVRFRVPPCAKSVTCGRKRLIIESPVYNLLIWFWPRGTTQVEELYGTNGLGHY